MSQGKGLGNKLKKSDVAKRKQSTDRRQAALEAWEVTTSNFKFFN